MTVVEFTSYTTDFFILVFSNAMEAGAIWMIFSFKNIIKIELIMADAPPVVITSKQRNALSRIERQETDLERIKLYNSQFYRE